VRSNPELGDLTPTFHDRLWVTRADLRMPLNVESNDGAAKLIKDRLGYVAPGLLKRIEFDPEYSCFFAYAKDQQDLSDLIGVIFDLVSEVEA
jgi:hypothetical protein